MLPRVVHTHHLTFHGPFVTKRYQTWERGEHRREWAVLRRIHENAGDLAPRPVEAMLDDRPPAITMSRVPGDPLAVPLSAAQVAAVADAVTRLWAVPRHAGLGRWSDDLHFARRLTAGPRPAAGILAEAFDAAVHWWTGPDPDRLRRRPAIMALGHRDPNLSNYLWDGRKVRIVDFEDAAISDPATELAIMIEHLAWRDAGADVGDLCGRFTVAQDRLLAARRLWAMFWLRLLLPGGPAVDRNPPGTAERQAQRLLALLHQRS